VRISAKSTGVGALGGLLLALSVVLVGTQSASAYNLESCEWPGPSTTWTYYSGPPSGYGTPINNAAKSWGNQTNFTYRKKDTVPAGVTVDVADYGNVSWWGVTSPTTCTQYFPFNLTIVRINRYHLNGTPGPEKRAVATHEFGHSLGLAHHNVGSPCNQVPIMNPYVNVFYGQCGHDTPQHDDEAGANAIYP
jgi:hypothetical protein